MYPHRSKYHAKRTTYAGRTYDSKKEAQRAAVLHALQAQGEITDLQEQVAFELQPAYTTKDGHKVRAVTYRADFTYTTKTGEQVVEDTKGFRTDTYKLKKKIFQYKYPQKTFVES